MTPENSESVPSPLFEGRFSGRIEFAALIRQALVTAADQGWREIIVCDPDFGDWPLGERVVAQALNDWSRSGRKFKMLARNYDAVTRQHARFVTWRRAWGHIVECRRIASPSAESLCSALWSPAWVFERLDLQRSSGTAGFDTARRTLLRERLNEWVLNSTPAFPATVLGL